MLCLNNNEALLTWLVIPNAFWVKRLFAARLAILPECVRCGYMEESIAHAFFSLSRHIGCCESFWKATWCTHWMKISVCSNIAPSSNRSEHCAYSTLWQLLFGQLDRKEFHEGKSLLSKTMVAFYKYQIKTKILSERIRLSTLCTISVSNRCLYHYVAELVNDRITTSIVAVGPRRGRSWQTHETLPKVYSQLKFVSSCQEKERNYENWVDRVSQTKEKQHITKRKREQT